MLLPLVNGLYAGIENQITDFGGCLGLYQVAVYGKEINESDYFFNRCQYRDRQIWNCPCDKKVNAVILTPAVSQIGKEVTVGLQYRVSENEADIRIKRFTNLPIQKNLIKTVPFWQVDKTTGDALGVVVFTLVILFVGLVVFFWKSLRKFFVDEKSFSELRKEEEELAKKYGKP